MHHNSNLFSKTLLKHTSTWILFVLFNKSITHIQPELIECIRSCTVTIKPDITTLSLTEFLSISLCYQRTCKTESLSLTTKSTTYQLCSCCHIAPLVVTAKLQSYTIFLILIKEIISLKQLISELRKRQTITSLTIETLLNRIFSHHVINSDMLTNFTNEIKKRKIFHPIVVVNKFCFVWSISIKIQKL